MRIENLLTTVDCYVPGIASGIVDAKLPAWVMIAMAHDQSSSWSDSPSYPRGVMFVWRLRANIIRTDPCCIVYHSCAQ